MPFSVDKAATCVQALPVPPAYDHFKSLFFCGSQTPSIQLIQLNPNNNSYAAPKYFLSLVGFDVTIWAPAWLRLIWNNVISRVACVLEIWNGNKINIQQNSVGVLDTTFPLAQNERSPTAG